jgi:hypothetical protein
VIHVIGYLWKAAGVFFGSDDPDDPGGHDWLRAILAGRAREVATGIRRSATTNDLRGSGRQTIDEVARYLDAKAPYLDYPTALAEGYPIATGVIEGACRHLVMDRFEVSGARWGLEGAEAVLGLRAVITNRDFDAYWQFYLHQERHRKRVRDRVRLAGDVEAASAAIIRRQRGTSYVNALLDDRAVDEQSSLRPVDPARTAGTGARSRAAVCLWRV